MSFYVPPHLVFKFIMKMIANAYRMINIAGRINSNEVPFLYFLLLFRRCHSSLNGFAGSLFSRLLITAYFSTFSCLKLLIKRHQRMQMTMPADNKKMDLISQMIETVAVNARLSETNKLFIESLR